MKVHIIGNTGSGKTTLCKLIGDKLSIPSADLDDFFWGPNWEERDHGNAIAEVSKFTNQNSWVICGNYKEVLPIIMDKADYVLWLDMPFWTNLARLSIRTFRRVVFHESCCNGNFETLYQVLFTKNSILYWYFKTFWKIRKRYSKLMMSSHTEQENRGGKIVRLTTDKEVRDFVELLSLKVQ